MAEIAQTISRTRQSIDFKKVYAFWLQNEIFSQINVLHNYTGIFPVNGHSSALLEASLTLCATDNKIVGSSNKQCLWSNTMYAVIKTGGKQYRVCVGEKIKVEQIPADVGSQITLDQVLLVGEGESVKIGAPVVAGAAVTASVLAHGRHDKIKIFKMRRRKHYQKHQGHRQNYTEIRIDALVVDAVSA
jgi:large subunit ribosomal protein L21